VPHTPPYLFLGHELAEKEASCLNAPIESSVSRPTALPAACPAHANADARWGRTLTVRSFAAQ